MVYIREAHPLDSAWPMPVPGGSFVTSPKSASERAGLARRCVTKLDIRIPCLVDDMDDTAEKAYHAWPDRLFVVDTDGTIAVRGKRGPWGFKPSVAKATEWLRRRFPAVHLDEDAAADDKHEGKKRNAERSESKNE